MTRDRGYPDWLVLSARLLAQPSCGQVTIVQNRCLIVFPCGYVKILQPVAICTVIFVTRVPAWPEGLALYMGLTSPCDVQETGPAVCGSISSFQGHRSLLCSSASASVHESPPHFPRQPG